MLIYSNLIGTYNKVETAIDRIRSFNPLELGFSEPYYVCYSGGKDSDCIRILMELSGVPYELVHNHTTMDAPETVYYVRSIPNIKISYPDKTIFQLIYEKHMPPTRLVRYCCAELKERGGFDRFVVTGVRWSESLKRRNRGLVEVQQPKRSDSLVLFNDNSDSRKMIEHCVLKGKRVLNPIIDWDDSDVWEFLNYYGCKSNPLYECGYKRIGCVGCPMSYKRKQEFDNYPRFKDNYIRCFDKMLQHPFYDTRNLSWHSGEEVFYWWVNDRKKDISDENQITFFDD